MIVGGRLNPVLLLGWMAGDDSPFNCWGSVMGGAVTRRGFNKLSARKVDTVKSAGRHGDGQGLYLVVDPSGARRWVFIYRWKQSGQKGPGRHREMGLGPVSGVSLQRAREKAADARALLADGKDPIAQKRSLQAVPTFGELADELIAAKSSALRSDKSVARWKRALGSHAESLRSSRVDAVSTNDVLNALKPIWTTKSETASMTRGYIEAVLDAAKARGYRAGENPARWRGHLDHLLPRPQKLARGHHKAMAFVDVSAFIAKLRAREATAADALEFLILTAARSGEVLNACWDEIDLASKIWTIPAERMKAANEHRVPLSAAAIKILEKMAKLRVAGSEVVFPGQQRGQPMSNMALNMLLRRLGVDVTSHGFRSSFRDWAGETTQYPRELAEVALAHTVGDETERAYRRGDALERRRPLMDDWATFCEPR
jgi:integrase